VGDAPRLITFVEVVEARPWGTRPV
jgi:hypothetical protein